MNKSNKSNNNNTGFSINKQSSNKFISKNDRDSNTNKINLPIKTSNEKQRLKNQRKRSINNSSVSLDQYEIVTKKGNKFGLLEYKRQNEIQNFDIYNGNIIINIKFILK